MKHNGFWNEFMAYGEHSDKSLDYWIKSLNYPTKSPERQILQLRGIIERRKSLPKIQRCIDYAKSSEDKTINSLLDRLVRLKELAEKRVYG